MKIVLLLILSLVFDLQAQFTRRRIMEPLIRSQAVGGGGPSVYTLLAHTITNAASTDLAVTPPLNTTGASLIVISLSHYNTAHTLSDSNATFGNNANTWTALPVYGNISGNGSNQLFYCLNPNVSAGHQFYATANYTVIAVQAFSGGTPAFDANNGNGSDNFTTLSTGSAAFSGTFKLAVSGFTFLVSGSAATVDSGFIITDQQQQGAASLFGAMSYTNSSNASENPTWTVAPSNVGSASIATFK